MTVAPADPSPRQRWQLPKLAAVTLILLVAAMLRFHLLDAQSLWHDEGNSAVQTTRSLVSIAENASRDIHPPGYYWLLKLWRSFLGESEFGLRSLSAFASLMTVALAFALGRALYGYLAGIAAAGLVALNTFNLYYAQEARMYALLALLSAASMWAFVVLLRRMFPKSPARSTRRWIIALALLNTAGLYTQYAFPFVLITQGIVFLLWAAISTWDTRSWQPDLRPHIMRPYLTATAIALLLFLPWLPVAYRQVTTWPNTGQSTDLFEALTTLIAYLSYGITRGTGTTIPVLFFLLFGLLMLPDDPPLEVRRRRWLAAMIPVTWVVVSLGLFLVLGLYREANLKLLLPAQIGLSLWMARGVQVMWSLKVRRETLSRQLIPKFAAVGGLALLLLDISGGINALYHNPAYQRDDYRAIASLIEADAGPGDAVILNAPNQQEVFDYYDDSSAPVYAIPRGLGGDDAATLQETRQIIANHSRIYALLWATEERDPNSVVERTLDAEAYEFDTTWYGDVRLVRYGAGDMPGTPQEAGVQFADSIVLQDYTLSATEASPGGLLLIDLTWQAIAPIETDYKVFVQLLPENGLPVVQRDSHPGGGQAPASGWPPGRLISDHHALFMPNDLTSAQYSLIIGLYNPDDPGERLPVEDGDFFSLGIITVNP